MRLARAFMLVLAPVAVLLTACSFDWDQFAPRGGGASGGVGAAAGHGGETSAGGGGGVGVGGAGGTPPTMLVDRGLLTRYFIAEADTGMGPPNLLDAAPNPLDLPIDYGDANPPPGGGGAGGMPVIPPDRNVMFTSSSGHRGLRFVEKNRSGGADVPVGGKLDVLDGQSQVTVECVAEVLDSGGGGLCGRISHLGVNSHGAVTLCSEPESRLSFRMNGSERENWDVGTTLQSRTVVHAVLDTTLADGARVRMYVDGVDLGPSSTAPMPVTQGETILFSGGRYVLGNRPSEDASLEGTLYYCALYSVALTASEVANNAALLLADDDAPPRP
jgi:hypothetical protein